MNTFDYAWIPYYIKVSKKINKIKSIKTRNKFIIKLDSIYKLGGIVPLYTTYNELYKLLESIKKIEIKN